MALVLNNNQNKAREYFGAELVITGGLFILLSVFLILYALFDNNIQAKQLDKVLLYVIPLGWVFFISPYFETLFQADNRIRELAQVRFYYKLGFLITALFFHFLFRHQQMNRLALVLIFNLFTQAIVNIIILIKLKVSFKNLKERLFEIWKFNKTYGFNVYFGSLFAVGFDQLTNILISYYSINNSGVGFYSLALTFSMPLSFIPNTIATTHYKDFSTAKSVPKKLFFITLGLSFAALFGLWLIVPPVIRFFYGVEFENVIFLNFIVSIGVIANGFGDFYNRYLGANGQGKALRNSSFYVGGSIMIFNLLFIPKWGETGAAFAKLITGFVYILIILHYYLRFIRKTK